MQLLPPHRSLVTSPQIAGRLLTAAMIYSEKLQAKARRYFHKKFPINLSVKWMTIVETSCVTCPEHSCFGYSTLSKISGCELRTTIS